MPSPAVIIDFVDGYTSGAADESNSIVRSISSEVKVMLEPCFKIDFTEL